MSALVVSYNGKTANLEKGQTGTLRCAGQIFATNFSVVFNSAGSFTYNGITVVGEAGKKSGFNCAGQIMATNIIISANEYGVADSPFPIPIPTAAEMTALIENATSKSVGAIYKYTGETTDNYTKGGLYIIAEEAE